MKSSKYVSLIAVVIFLAATAHAAKVDMKDPRRALGREDDIRVDAELYQDTVANNSPLNITYRIQNLTDSPIAIADKISDVSYDEDSCTITVSIGAEVPADNSMPHLVVIPPGAKKTMTGGGVFNTAVASSKFGRVPRYVQIKVNVLRDIAPFSALIEQQSKSAAPVPLPTALFDKWLDASDTIFCNAIPVRWTSKPRSDVPSAEQRAPSGSW